MLQSCHITTCDPSDFSESPNEISQSFLSFPYYRLLEKIKLDIDSGGFQTSNKTPGNVMRIALCSLGSPLFNSGTGCLKDITRFLYLLKALLRKSFAVAIVTVPSYITQVSSFCLGINWGCLGFLRLNLVKDKIAFPKI